jgi:hypothetical protein
MSCKQDYFRGDRSSCKACKCLSQTIIYIRIQVPAVFLLLSDWDRLVTPASLHDKGPPKIGLRQDFVGGLRQDVVVLSDVKN